MSNIGMHLMICFQTSLISYQVNHNMPTVAWIIATVIKNHCKGSWSTWLKSGCRKKLVSATEGGQTSEAIQTLGKIAYYLVFILFYQQYSRAEHGFSRIIISQMMTNILNFLPTLLVSAVRFSVYSLLNWWALVETFLRTSTQVNITSMCSDGTKCSGYPGSNRMDCDNTSGLFFVVEA